MSDSLLPYYNRELTELRALGRDFADAHPQLAGRLRLSDGVSDDPHVERLIQAVAFLNARTARRLDDSVADIVDVLLDIIDPGCLAPLPSMTVVQFDPWPGMTAPYPVPAHAELDSERIERRRCRFRTCYPTTIWPIRLADARLERRPDAAGEASLRFTFAPAADDLSLSTLAPDRLRLFFAGDQVIAFALLEHALHGATGVTFSTPESSHGVWRPRDAALAPVGFAPDETILPAADNQRRGAQLFREFLVFPAKHLFLDVIIPPEAAAVARKTLHVDIHLPKLAPRLDRSVDRDFFRLGCTPAVNLFRRQTDAFALDPTQLEHLLIADARSETPVCVHTVMSVTAMDSSGRTRRLPPLFHADWQGPDVDIAWQARRRPSSRGGTDVWLSFATRDPGEAPEIHVAAEALCTNGDAPHALPFGHGGLRLSPAGDLGAVSMIRAVTPPTPSAPASDPTRRRWDLLARLGFNHLSLEGPEAANVLGTLLRLQDIRQSPQTRRLVGAVTHVRATREVRRIACPDIQTVGAEALCHGLAITVKLDAAALSGSNAWLFAQALDRFLAMHATVNAFTRLTVETNDGGVYACPARVGETCLA